MLSILAEARCKKVSSCDATGPAVSWNWSRSIAGKPKSARPSQAARLTSSNDYRYGNLPRFGVSWPLIENAWSAAGSTFGSHRARDSDDGCARRLSPPGCRMRTNGRRRHDRGAPRNDLKDRFNLARVGATTRTHGSGGEARRIERLIPHRGRRTTEARPRT